MTAPAALALDQYRLTRYAHGGGCACKIPPGELEEMVAGLRPGRRPCRMRHGELVVGLDDGDDAAVVWLDGGALVATADFFTPVVDDAYDWGRIAAANALSDVYAMGGHPRGRRQPARLAARRAPRRAGPGGASRGLDVAAAAGCHVAGGHSVDAPEPMYGMSVTGVADVDRLLRNDAGVAGPAPDSHQAARRRRPEQPAQGDGREVRRRRSTPWPP